MKDTVSKQNRTTDFNILVKFKLFITVKKEGFYISSNVIVMVFPQ